MECSDAYWGDWFGGCWDARARADKSAYDVRIASRTPVKLAEFSSATGIQAGTFSDVAIWAEAVVLAVAGAVTDEALREVGPANLKGKLVIDTTNPIAKERLEDGVIRCCTSPNSSLMERL